MEKAAPDFAARNVFMDYWMPLSFFPAISYFIANPRTGWMNGGNWGRHPGSWYGLASGRFNGTSALWFSGGNVAFNVARLYGSSYLVMEVLFLFLKS